MKRLIDKYTEKLVKHGLCNIEDVIFGELDAEIDWNSGSPKIKILEHVIAGLNINSILFAKPAEPYFSIINFLTKNNNTAIYPQDCETRTFLHDIPVIDKLEANAIIEALKSRKAVIIPNHGIVAFGTVSPEQAFITFSSVCFSCFVKFFTDYYRDKSNNNHTEFQTDIMLKAYKGYSDFLDNAQLETGLKEGPFRNSEQTVSAMLQAGKLVVNYRLVDSFFGNISYKLDNTIFISQTTSSLDELAGCIDPCPLDNSTCTALTASSELSAHKEILINQEGISAILHGHPKFCVIMSMICKQRESCSKNGECHIKCPEQRFIKDIPIVPGEVGTGKYGLCNTLPPAIKNRRGAIVYGHGLFTVGKKDYKDAFKNLLDIEKMCIKEFLTIIS